MINKNATKIVFVQRSFFFILSCFTLMAMTSSQLKSQERKEPCLSATVANWDNCFGAFVKPNEFSYKGEFKKGKRDGDGTLVVLNKRFYGDTYTGSFKTNLMHGYGTYKFRNGDVYIGLFNNGKRSGLGTLIYKNGDKYDGEFDNDKRHGKGILYLSNGLKYQGAWENDQLIEQKELSKIKPPPKAEIKKSTPSTTPPFKEADAISPNQQTDETSQSQPFELNITVSEIDDFGNFSLEITSTIEMASLLINEVEFKTGLKNKISISLHAPVRTTTNYQIKARNINGKQTEKIITISRDLKKSKLIDQLEPGTINPAVRTDSLAIIIGIEKYKRLSAAKYAANDAKYFFDYAQKALGIDPKNILLLTDNEADSISILSAISRWSRPRVKSGHTDIFFFFSGHGFHNPKNNEYYFLTHDSDVDILEKSSVSLSEVINSLADSKPKHITLLLDACFSGINRSGEPLNRNIRPVIPVTPTQEKFKGLPSNLTILSASNEYEYSASSDFLNHGLFSFYLMKGLEGFADSVPDGLITVNELISYISENIEKHSAVSLHKQHPQATGDLGKAIAKINLLKK